MALFGRDYDQDYGYRYGSYQPTRDWAGRERSGWPARADYHGDYGYAGQGRTFDESRGSYNRGYGEPYTENDWYRGYDRGYKSRQQTDYGDPFGDRQQRTPMRVIRGPATGYDRGFRPNRYSNDYDTSGYPMGYMPYSSRAGYDTAYSRRMGRGYDRGGMSGWY